MLLASVISISSHRLFMRHHARVSETLDDDLLLQVDDGHLNDDGGRAEEGEKKARRETNVQIVSLLVMLLLPMR